jgi:hypothetical protein
MNSRTMSRYRLFLTCLWQHLISKDKPKAFKTSNKIVATASPITMVSTNIKTTKVETAITTCKVTKTDTTRLTTTLTIATNTKANPVLNLYQLCSNQSQHLCHKRNRSINSRSNLYHHRIRWLKNYTLRPCQFMRQ